VRTGGTISRNNCASADRLDQPLGIEEAGDPERGDADGDDVDQPGAGTRRALIRDRT
jgi:hypothetical protein